MRNLFLTAANRAAMVSSLQKSLDKEQTGKLAEEIKAELAVDFDLKSISVKDVVRVEKLIDLSISTIDEFIDATKAAQKRNAETRFELKHIPSFDRKLLDQAQEQIVEPNIDLNDDSLIDDHDVEVYRNSIKASLGFYGVDGTFKNVIEDDTTAKAVAFIKASKEPVGSDIADEVKTYAESIEANRVALVEEVADTRAADKALLEGNLDEAEAEAKALVEKARKAKSKADADRIAELKASIEADIKEIKSRLRSIEKASQELDTLAPGSSSNFAAKLSEILIDYGYLREEDAVPSTIPTRKIIEGTRAA